MFKSGEPWPVTISEILEPSCLWEKTPQGCPPSDGRAVFASPPFLSRFQHPAGRDSHGGGGKGPHPADTVGPDSFKASTRFVTCCAVVRNLRVLQYPYIMAILPSPCFRSTWPCFVFCTRPCTHREATAQEKKRNRARVKVDPARVWHDGLDGYRWPPPKLRRLAMWLAPAFDALQFKERTEIFSLRAFRVTVDNHLCIFEKVMATEASSFPILGGGVQCRPLRRRKRRPPLIRDPNQDDYSPRSRHQKAEDFRSSGQWQAHLHPGEQFGWSSLQMDLTCS